MIIEKTLTENNRYDVELKDFVAEGELTVTITLSEYRELIEKSVENRMRKDHESWVEQYNRANKAEERVKELEDELKDAYKKILASDCAEESEVEDDM